MDDEPVAVYRLRDSNLALLYVGVAKDPEQRWGKHKATKAWWPEVAARDVEWHPNREAALVAEAEAITTEAPRYNIVVPDPENPMHWPPPDWAQRQADGAARARESAEDAGRCPHCKKTLPPPKICEGCGETFYRSENGHVDAVFCSKRCSRKVAMRAWRRRQKFRVGP